MKNPRNFPGGRGLGIGSGFTVKFCYANHFRVEAVDELVWARLVQDGPRRVQDSSTLSQAVHEAQNMIRIRWSSADEGEDSGRFGGELSNLKASTREEPRSPRATVRSIGAREVVAKLAKYSDKTFFVSLHPASKAVDPVRAV